MLPQLCRPKSRRQNPAQRSRPDQMRHVQMRHVQMRHAQHRHRHRSQPPPHRHPCLRQTSDNPRNLGWRPHRHRSSDPNRLPPPLHRRRLPWPWPPSPSPRRRPRRAMPCSFQCRLRPGLPPSSVEPRRSLCLTSASRLICKASATTLYLAMHRSNCCLAPRCCASPSRRKQNCGSAINPRDGASPP